MENSLEKWNGGKEERTVKNGKWKGRKKERKENRKRKTGQ